MDLTQTKVVVVDDKREAAQNLLKLLDRNGIAYNYYFEGGDMGNLPSAPMKNVRLIFLDFVLGTDGQTVKNKIATLLGVLENIIHKENGPYIIAAWTINNAELLEPFKVALFASTDIPKPVMIIDMNKAAIMSSLRNIERKIKSTFDGTNMFEIIFGWESNGQAALADVVKMLSDISVKNISTPPLTLDQFSASAKKALERNMYRFAVSAAGEKNLTSDTHILIDAQTPFAGIFHDNLEGYIKSRTPELQKLSKKIYRNRSKSVPKYTPAERAQMNNYFLLESSPEASIKPGNIYKRDAILSKIHKTGKVTFTKSDFYNKPSTPTRLAHTQELNRRVIPVVMEVTPECDYAQKKWKGAKFVSGILYPEKYLDGGKTDDQMKSADKISPPIPLYYNNQVYFLVFHAGYQSVLPLTQIKTIKPILRARKDLLVDIQHWLASHSSRPGKLEF